MRGSHTLIETDQDNSTRKKSSLGFSVRLTIPGIPALMEFENWSVRSYLHSIVTVQAQLIVQNLSIQVEWPSRYYLPRNNRPRITTVHTRVVVSVPHTSRRRLLYQQLLRPCPCPRLQSHPRRRRRVDRVCGNAICAHLSIEIRQCARRAVGQLRLLLQLRLQC